MVGRICEVEWTGAEFSPLPPAHSRCKLSVTAGACRVWSRLSVWARTLHHIMQPGQPITGCCVRPGGEIPACTIQTCPGLSKAREKPCLKQVFPGRHLSDIRVTQVVCTRPCKYPVMSERGINEPLYGATLQTTDKLSGRCSLQAGKKLLPDGQGALLLPINLLGSSAYCKCPYKWHVHLPILLLIKYFLCNTTNEDKW